MSLGIPSFISPAPLGTIHIKPRDMTMQPIAVGDLICIPRYDPDATATIAPFLPAATPPSSIIARVVAIGEHTIRYAGVSFDGRDGPGIGYRSGHLRRGGEVPMNTNSHTCHENRANMTWGDISPCRVVKVGTDYIIHQYSQPQVSSILMSIDYTVDWFLQGSDARKKMPTRIGILFDVLSHCVHLFNWGGDGKNAIIGAFDNILRFNREYMVDHPVALVTAPQLKEFVSGKSSAIADEAERSMRYIYSDEKSPTYWAKDSIIVPKHDRKLSDMMFSVRSINPRLLENGWGDPISLDYFYEMQTEHKR